MSPCACGCGEEVRKSKYPSRQARFVHGHNARKSLDVKFFSKFETGVDCWEWRGYRNPYGYGMFSMGRGPWMLAHRFSYENYVGPIPDGLVIDHLCRNRACVNPSHMEPVTIGENVRRGEGAAIAGRNRLARTHCRNGHEYTVANTYYRESGARVCRACRRETEARYMAKRS